jgi:hypothetical protein
MANATRYGFKPVMKGNGLDPNPRKYPLTASQTIAIGDVVILDSAGRVSVGASNSAAGLYLGVAASSCTSSTAGDPIYVWDDPNMIFEAMVSTGALADCYTTRSSAACFDLTGTTGAQYVNSSGSTYDVFKVIGECAKDPTTGVDSAVGTNQMKYVKFNLASHAYGTLA